MKKVVFFIISLFFMNLSFAADASLRMKIAGPIKDNRYFLCMSHVGCVSILNGNKGKVYPMEAGEVNNILVLNAGNRALHVQELPASCQKMVTKGQTVTVSGKLVKGANEKVVLGNLRCSVG